MLKQKNKKLSRDLSNNTLSIKSLKKHFSSLEKLIYESDIVKYKDSSNTPQIGEVQWWGYEYVVDAFGGDDGGNQNLELHPDYEFEVTGNKFENPNIKK